MPPMLGSFGQAKTYGVAKATFLGLHQICTQALQKCAEFILQVSLVALLPTFFLTLWLLARSMYIATIAVSLTESTANQTITWCYVQQLPHLCRSAICHRLLTIHLEFHHIKDHQDTRFNKVLTILEKLNFDCYAWALSLVLYTHIETLQDIPSN